MQCVFSLISSRTTLLWVAAENVKSAHGFANGVRQSSKKPQRDCIAPSGNRSCYAFAAARMWDKSLWLFRMVSHRRDRERINRDRNRDRDKERDRANRMGRNNQNCSKIDRFAFDRIIYQSNRSDQFGYLSMGFHCIDCMSEGGEWTEEWKNRLNR